MTLTAKFQLAKAFIADAAKNTGDALATSLKTGGGMGRRGYACPDPEYLAYVRKEQDALDQRIKGRKAARQAKFK